MLLAALSAVCAGAAAANATTAAESFGPGRFQSFVGNWSPANVPLCAAIRSAAEWNIVFHPAPVMGVHKSYGPRASFWPGHAILLIGRMVPGSDRVDAFRLGRLQRDGGTLEVQYTFAPAPASSWTEKQYLDVTISKPVPTTIRFRENGHVVCSLAPGSGRWLSPVQHSSP